MEETEAKRFLSKNFECQNCHCQFKKLVGYKSKTTECPKCSFTKCAENNVSHPLTQAELLRKRLAQKVTPFSVSPFSKSVTRSHIDFTDILEDDIITTPTEDFFIDNYASNFISNFSNPMSRVVFIQSQNNHNKESSPPLQNKFFKKIKIITMHPKFCKTLESTGQIELPNCFICLKDIPLNDKAVLLRCGHLYHYNCIMEWLKKHSVCSICKFDAILKNIHKSSIDIAQEKEDDLKSIPVLPLKKVPVENKTNITNNFPYAENINILGESQFIY